MRVAVVPSKQKLFVQPKLKNNNVRLIRYTLYECLAKRCVFNLDVNRERGLNPERYQEGYSVVWEPNIKKALPPLVDFAILSRIVV